MKKLTLSLIIMTSLMLMVIGGVSAADKRSAITSTADRLVILQSSSDTGWDWIITGLNAHTGDPSAHNMYGVVILGLLDAYEETNTQSYFDAATAMANHMTSGNASLGEFYKQGGVQESAGAYDYQFLMRYAEVSGNSSYSDYAIALWNWNKANTSIFASPEALNDALLGWAGSDPGAASWMLAAFGTAIHAMGDDTFATGCADLIVADLADDGEGWLVGDHMAEAESLEFLSELNSVTYSSTIDRIITDLVDAQQADGYWDDGFAGTFQDTAYSVRALAKYGGTDGLNTARKGAAWLIANQLENGGWIDDSGGSPEEYSEQDAEALRALVTTAAPVTNDGKSYYTIQSAIDAATTGDTIEVAAGTYEEDLVITTDNLELVGVDKTTTTIKGIANVPIASWPLGVPNIEILADGVKIHGFTIEGPDRVVDTYSSGIVLDGTNIGIYDNDFVTTSAETTGEIAHAITTISKEVVGFETADVSGLNIHDNTFTGSGVIGSEFIYINPHTGSGTITIDNNEFSGSTNIGMTIESGNTIVSNNVISSDIDSESPPYGTYGIRFMDTTYAGNYENIVISNNNIQHVKRAIRIGNGLYPETSIFVASILSNTLTNNDVGIWGRNGNNVTATYNLISGNTVGIQNDIATVVNAINNWWGASTGPNTVGADSVSANVDYDPWIGQASIDSDVDTIAGTPEDIDTTGTNASITLTTSIDQTNATVTVMQYEENPGEDLGLFAISDLNIFVSVTTDIPDEEITEVEIKIYYDDTALGDIPEYSLQPYYWNPETVAWEDIVNFTLNTVDNYMVFTVTHLSLFTVGSEGNVGGEGGDFIALSVPNFIDYGTLYSTPGRETAAQEITLTNVGSLDILVTPVWASGVEVFKRIKFSDDSGGTNIGYIKDGEAGNESSIYTTTIDAFLVSNDPLEFSNPVTVWTKIKIALDDTLAALKGPQTGTIYFQAVEV